MQRSKMHFQAEGFVRQTNAEKREAVGGENVGIKTLHSWTETAKDVLTHFTKRSLKVPYYAKSNFDH